MSEQISPQVMPERALVVRAVLRTDTGLVRSENQDFGACTTLAEEKVSHPGGRLLIVADGMGGHRGGATASRLAAETVKAQYLGSETTDIPTALRESLARANARIHAEAQSNPELRGMGTTTSVLAVRGGQGWVAHVGDSRVYLVRDGAIQQLTDDHSLVATMVREGLLTSQEAETHPRRNVLQRSMGVSEEVEIDVRGPIELREGDTFILCSDGLHGVVKEHELNEIAGTSIEAAADEFVRRALERGAPDNVTVIVARVEPAGPAGAEGERWEETQPLEPMDSALYDETVKEPAPDAAEPPPSAAPPPMEARRTAFEDTEKIPALRDEPAAAVELEVDPDAPTAELPIGESADVIAIAQSAAASAQTAKVAAIVETPPTPAAQTAATPGARDEIPPARRVSAPPRPQPPARPRRSLLRWFLVLVLVLGAAGVVWYLNTQRPVVTQSSRP